MRGERVLLGWRKRLPLALALWAQLFPLTAYRSPLTAQIQDNSFLVEEAYNQERGVVQHISTYQRSETGSWAYSFIQEWPLGGIRSQLSYTIPIESPAGLGTGLGDLALNYRYQLLGGPNARTILAPRLSLLLPTGAEEKGRGNGGVGLQLNLPLTLVLSNPLVSHWNAGATLIPSASNGAGEKAATHALNLGASLVWLFRPRLNFLVETLWEDARSLTADGQMVSGTSWVLSPGVRAAFNFAGGLQVVPGLAYSVGLKDADENAWFLYLSFEHPFQRQ